MIDTYRLIIDEMLERKIAYVEKYFPSYIASIGAHIFNIMNKEAQMHFVQGLLWDARIHPFMVAPPGFSKTFFQEQFIDENFGVLAQTTIHCGFEGYMTEAAWVGQVRWIGEEAVPTYGAAHEYANGIIGVDEFGAIVEAMKTSHSKQLDTQILTSLDKGRVRKRVGPGKLHYQTNVTLWAATQTLRLDLSSGMGRRLLFMTFFPTEEDKERLRNIYLEGHNVRYNPARLKAIRERINSKMETIHTIKHLIFDEHFKQWFRTNKIIHYEIPVYERLILGYNIMRLNNFPSKLIIKMDTESLRLIKQELMWRNQIKRGGRVSQIIQLLNESSGAMPLNLLRDRLVDFGMDWRQSSEEIGNLQKSRIIRIDSTGIVRLWRGHK